jgi:hypothetical protein
LNFNLKHISCNPVRNKTIALNSNYYEARYKRGDTKHALKDFKGALAGSNQCKWFSPSLDLGSIPKSLDPMSPLQKEK